MDEKVRLEAADEYNWVYNAGNFPSVVFFAHYFPYTLISARDVLSTHEEWKNDKHNDHNEDMLNALRTTTPEVRLLKPRNIELARNEFETAKDVATVIGTNGGEVGSGIDQTWNPFRKDIDGEFKVMPFLRDCGVSEDYLNSKCTTLKSSLKEFVSFFNELLNYDVEHDQLLNVESSLEEVISAAKQLNDEVQYKRTVMHYLNALAILYKESENVYYTHSGIYTSRGIDARFLFAYKRTTNTVLGCFQVLYLS